MTNIKDLVLSHNRVYQTLVTAGNLGAELGIETYVIGGLVRDLFLNRELKEIDLMIVGDGIAYARELANRLGVSSIVSFKQFGTAKIPYRLIPVEVASARTESYNEESRKPAKVVYCDLKGDLLRRDFTINAMAMDILPEHFGELHDPYGGIADLTARQLVTPMDPNETFSEDPLRMLRAAYFVAQLNFRIGDSVLESMKQQADRIKIVSWERITAEIVKILNAPKPSLGFILLQRTGLLKYVFPEIEAMVGLDQTGEWHHKDIFYHTLQVVDNAAWLNDKMEIRFAALVHDIAKPKTRRVDREKGYTFYGHDDLGARMINTVSARMKLSNELSNYLQKMTALHLRPIALAKEGVTDSAVRRLMVATGDDIDDLLILCRADITSKNPLLIRRYMGNFERVEKRMQDVVERDKMKAFQSPVRGNEIMEVCGINEGKLVGKIKSAIEEAILDGQIDNNYEAAFAYLQKIKYNYIKDK